MITRRAFTAVSAAALTASAADTMPVRRLGNINFKVGRARLIAPDNCRAALRYAWSTPGLAVAIAGMRDRDELRMGLQAAREFQPLKPLGVSGLTSRGQSLAAQWGPLRGPVA